MQQIQRCEPDKFDADSALQQMQKKVFPLSEQGSSTMFCDRGFAAKKAMDNTSDVHRDETFVGIGLPRHYLTLRGFFSADRLL